MAAPFSVETFWDCGNCCTLEDIDGLYLRELCQSEKYESQVGPTPERPHKSRN
jgi:hypothetical protein